MAEVKEKGASDFFDPNNIDLSDEKVRQIMSKPGQMFGLAAMQLADDGVITEEDAEYFYKAKALKAFDQSEQVPDEEPNQARELKRKDAEAAIYKCLAEWNEEKKAEVVKVQYPKMVKEFADIFVKKSPIVNVVGFVFAYIASFSLFDLLWFPIAMVTAYKFGTGESS